MDLLSALCLTIASLSVLAFIIILLKGRKTSLLDSSRLAIAEERARAVPGLEEKIHLLQEALSVAKTRNVELEVTVQHEAKAYEEKLRLFQQAESRLIESFKLLSADALQANNKHFLDTAKMTFEELQAHATEDLGHRHKAIADLLKPVRDSLKGVDEKLNEVEKSRIGAYAGLKQQVSFLLEAQKELRTETSNLVNALKTPSVRGRWGEMQLRRVVEMAGMLAHCDFLEQVSTLDESGDRLRPDMIVRLPGGQNIVIDAKAPMSAYLDSLECENPKEQAQKAREHAQQVRNHIKALSAKAYWSQFKDSPEFVVLFLPGETFFSAALKEDATLIELGAENKVILSTPTTLIALLRAVSYGWRQEKLAENAREISTLGQVLYERLSDFSSHLQKLGKNLDQTVSSYNHTIGSLEHRVFSSARRFEQLGIETQKKKVVSLDPIERQPRDVMIQSDPQKTQLTK